jgi:2'-5' RNA ligase
MILYESATNLHGRIEPFDGEYYRNFFLHYTLADYKFENEQDCLDQVKRIISKIGKQEQAGFDQIAAVAPKRATQEVYGLVSAENNKNFDVVKFNVVPSFTLQNLNSKLSEFPNSNEYPEYKPHITIAYVKKGSGKKYEDLEYRHSVENVDEVCYSVPGGSREYFKI